MRCSPRTVGAALLSTELWLRLLYLILASLADREHKALTSREVLQ